MAGKTVRARWTPEARSVALRQVEAGQSIEDAALSLGIASSTLRKWLRLSHEDQVVDSISQPKGKTFEQREIAHLRAEVARLKAECDVARRAARYFAQYAHRGLLCSTK